MKWHKLTLMSLCTPLSRKLCIDPSRFSRFLFPNFKFKGVEPPASCLRWTDNTSTAQHHHGSNSRHNHSHHRKCIVFYKISFRLHVVAKGCFMNFCVWFSGTVHSVWYAFTSQFTKTICHSRPLKLLSCQWSHTRINELKTKLTY